MSSRPKSIGANIASVTQALNERWTTPMYRWLMSAVFALTTFAGIANAVTVKIDTTYDLGALGMWNISPLDNGPVNIAEGDHVIFTVTFRDNLALTVRDYGDVEDFFAMVVGHDNESSFTINNARILFLGFTGTGGADRNYVLGTQSDGLSHIGPSMRDFLSDGQTITFTGYRTIFDVESIAVSPHMYDRTLLRFLPTYASIGPARRIPEPAPIALIAFALFGLAWVQAGASRRGPEPAA